MDILTAQNHPANKEGTGRMSRICCELVFSNDLEPADVPKLLTAEFKHR